MAGGAAAEAGAIYMADTKIFLSHSHKDNAYCEMLVNLLTAAGMDVWFDEEKLDEGELGEVIERELQSRDVFVVVLSPDALASRWVEKETRMFEALRRRDKKLSRRKLVPVVAHPLVENEIWLFLDDYKRQQGPDGAALSADEAAARIQRIVGGVVPVLAGPAPPPLPMPQQGWRWAEAALITIGALLTCVAFTRTDPLGLGIYVAGLSLVAAGFIAALVTLFRRRPIAWRLMFALAVALCGAIHLFFVRQDDVKTLPQLLVIFAASAVPADVLLLVEQW